MHNSIITQIKNHPLMFVLSVGLHLLLVVILTFNMSPSAPKMPTAKKVDTVKAVIIDANVVEKEKQKLIRAEKNKRDKQVAQTNKLDRDAKKAKDKRKKEEKRLAKLKNDEQKRKQKLAKKEKAEKQKKKNEIAKLKQEQKALEKKRRDEQQKLAAIEAKRKTEEAAERKKQLDKKRAAEAEVRRKAQEAEMRVQMQEEERLLAKRSAENQKLLAQYLSQIQRKVENKWNAPAGMISGWSCEIIVVQNRFGEVQSVRTKQCSGSEAFKSTVERAVQKASPLPEAPNNDVFDKELIFTFRPNV